MTDYDPIGNLEIAAETIATDRKSRLRLAAETLRLERENGELQAKIWRLELENQILQDKISGLTYALEVDGL